MNAALAIAMLAVCVTLSACAGPSARAAPGPDRQAASQQVLVMLRMPPAHFRAGAGYGGTYPDDPGAPSRRRAAQALARAHGLRLVDSWPMPVIGVDCFVMQRRPGIAPGPLLEALERDPRVAWAQPMNAFHGMGSGDPLYAIQPAARYWRLAELHRVSTGRGVRVALVDSGVDGRHPDLAGQVELQENFVDEGPAPAEAHGTAVAGVLAARAGNGIGIAGIAPGVRLLALRACWQAAGQGASCSSFTLGKALNFAILHDVRIINLSLAGPPDRLLDTLAVAAQTHGAAVVGALDPGRPDGFPASSAGVLLVAGQHPRALPAQAPARAGTLLAPSADIPTCLPGARWGLVSGASYATAHVSGLLALLAELQPGADPAQLKSDIVVAGDAPMLQNAVKTTARQPGAGSIDACATIARAAAACACSCPPAGPPAEPISASRGR